MAPSIRAVVLLAEHTPEKGAFGLISQSSLWKNSWRSDSAILNFLELWQIPVHTRGAPSPETSSLSRLFWKRGFQIRALPHPIAMDEAKTYLGQPNTLVKAFAGYSGWSEGQLEEEVAQDAWTITEPKPQPPQFAPRPHSLEKHHAWTLTLPSDPLKRP